MFLKLVTTLFCAREQIISDINKTQLITINTDLIEICKSYEGSKTEICFTQYWCIADIKYEDLMAILSTKTVEDLLPRERTSRFEGLEDD